MGLTSSKLNVKLLIRRLLEAKRQLGFIRGPAISLSSREILRSKDTDDMMHGLVFKMFDAKIFLFPSDITSHKLIAKYTQCYRTF